jgi:filamentous hemagglutinin family protein
MYNMNLRPKSLIRPIAKALALAMVVPPIPVWAAPPVTVAPGGGNTTVYTSANGVAVVNIATANGAGLSHNKFTDYNVPANGLVLNNGNSAEVARQSQLAGLVSANKNLTSQASLILNEVVSTNRSVLQGYTEVLGGKADVVVANPNGITCSGCGFINTDRVTMATGTPNLAADGSLRDFGVNRGDILINGAGVNASAQQYLDLVSRSVKVDGQINAPNFRVTVGNNVWNYASGMVTGATTASGAAPSYAFDSTALGGMYAGRIKVVATEVGVGVRMQGEAAASADDFSINAAGKIEIGSKISAERNISLTSTAVGTDAIALSDTSLTAKNNLELNASSGGARLSGGVLVANNNLTMVLGTLSDSASASAMIDNNKRYAGTTMIVGASGAASVNGVSYGSAGLVDATVGSLAVGANGATLYSDGALNLRATTGNLALGNAALNSAGNMALVSDAGALSFGSGALVKSTGGNVNVTAETGLSNDGLIRTDNGNIVARVSGTFANTGQINASGLLDVADKSNGKAATLSLTGSGKMGGNTVSVKSDHLKVLDASVLTSVGDMALSVNDLVLSSKILGVTGGLGTLRVTGPGGSLLGVDVVTSNGLLHSGQDLSITDADAGGSNGTISAVRDLVLRGHNEMRGNYIAGRDVTVTSAHDVNFLMNDQPDGMADSLVSAGRDVSISGYDVRNWAIISAGNNVNINASRYFENAKNINVSGARRRYDFTTGALDSTISTQSQIIAGNAITISSVHGQTQNAGLISAPTVNIVNNMTNADTITATHVNVSGTYGGYLANVAGGTSTGTAVTATNLAPVPTPGGVSFGGVVISIPTNPNGLYIPVQNPSSRYLVESNPLFMNIDNFLGSDYLAQKYNLQPESVLRRLGDAAYETYLVRQQLIALTGSNLVDGVTEKAQMQNLMDHAGSQAKNLGLVYGKGLSSAQQAALKEDMVWMVETIVNGQKVLAPVVYLAATTRQLFDGSPTIASAGDSLVMNVGSLTNAGTIRGKAVDITASNDVRNLGGTIKGGDLSVTSTGGSVINSAQVDELVIKRGDGFIDLKTTVGKAGSIQGTGTVNVSAAKNVENIGGSIQGKDINLAAGGDVVNSAIVATNVSGTAYRETVAAQGNVSATGNLNVQAGRDVQNLGSQMDSGGDAKIVAARDVSFDTVALTNRDISSSSKRSFTENSNSRTTTTTVDQMQGGASTGGNLAIKSGRDVTLAAADLSAGKRVAIDAGGDLNIVARNRTSDTVKESNTSGVGVGGGVYGEQKKTSDQFASRAVGSTVTTVTVGGAETTLSNAKGSVAGGDIILTAGKTATLEGAKVNSSGATTIAAQDVQVLAAKDIDRTTTTTETTRYLSTSTGDGDKSSSLSRAGVKSDGVVKAGANASATNDAGGVDFVKATKTTTFDEDTRSVGSKLASAGGLTIVSKKDLTLQGAEVKAGGDVSLAGEQVNILAAQDTHVSTSSTTTTRVGLYASTTNAADAKAGAGATANAAIGAANANAGSNATANAGSTTSIDVVRTKTTTTESVDITNRGTTLAAAGNLSIHSAETLTVQGSDVSGDKGVGLKAKEMAFLAAQDIHTRSTSTTATNAGLYIDGNANSSAAANASANVGLGANAGVKSEAGANAVASVGVQGRNVTSSQREGSSTARVSTITSSAGSIARQAENSITDVGTAIDAAGDFSQSAKTITSKAAENTSFSASDSTTNTAKVGVYAKAEGGVSSDAGASAGLGMDGKPKAEAGANAEAKAKVGAGVKASYSRDTAASGDTSTDAVVSTIRAGGKVTSISSDKTSLEGTQIAAGQGGIEIQASSLDFSAARSMTSSSSSTGNTNASASVGVSRGSGKGVDVDVAAGTSSTSKRADTSTATAGSMTTTGDLVIKISGDTRLEGTHIAALGDTTVAAGGNLVFDAARDTARSSKTAYDASASVSTSNSSGVGGATRSGVDASVSGGFSRSTAESSTATAGSINTGGKLTLTAGKSASFEGTNMSAGGDATISAKDSVTISAARSTSSSESYGARVGLSAGGGKENTAAESSSGKSASATVEGNYSNAKSSTAEAGSLTSGGNLKIVSNKDVNLEGTNLAADGKASVLAGGSVNIKAAESTSSSIGVSASLSGSAEKTDKTPTAPTPKAAPKNPGTGGTQGSDGSKQSNADLSKWQKNQASVVQELKAKQAGTGAGSTSRGMASAPAANEAGPTTESKGSVSLGAQVQTKNSTVQKAGSITAGSGGVEVVAAGGDVNLVGTRIATAGDADINAKGDVNISATRSTSSGINVAGAASADRAREAPTNKSSTGAKPSGTNPSTPGAATDRKTPPPVPTAPKPERKANGTASPSAPSTDKKTPPPVPTAPKPERKANGTASPSAPSTDKKTPPPVPTAPKPERKSVGIGSQATSAANKTPASTEDTAKLPEATAAAAKEKDPNKFGGSVEGSTNTDANKSSTFVGVGGGGSVKNQGATITTGGKVNIQSGGKTTLTNTEIKSAGGENIDAKGGVERKTERDVSVMNASTDSGPAGANQVLSKVPTATANPATGAPAAPGTPGMATTDSNQGANAAPQSALKAAQGGKSSTPGVKKN